MFSHQKEVEHEGELHNAVLVVAIFLDTDQQEAAHHVGELMTARLQQFEHIARHELPTLFDTARLANDTQTAVLDYVQHLRHWLSGILNWHRKCHRYAEADVIANRRPVAPGDLTSVDSTALLAAPTGLGTTAARLAQELAGRRVGTAV